MNLKRNELIVIGLSLLLSTLSAAQSQHLERVELFEHPGLQWLSWTPGERENFVYGYIHGYAHGMGEACLAADKLFEKDKPHVIGHDNVPSSFPSARCLRSVAQYPLIKIILQRDLTSVLILQLLQSFIRNTRSIETRHSHF
jgi:hypothetical protein